MTGNENVEMVPITMRQVKLFMKSAKEYVDDSTLRIFDATKTFKDSTGRLPTEIDIAVDVLAEITPAKMNGDLLTVALADASVQAEMFIRFNNLRHLLPQLILEYGALSATVALYATDPSGSEDDLARTKAELGTILARITELITDGR